MKHPNIAVIHDPGAVDERRLARARTVPSGDATTSARVAPAGLRAARGISIAEVWGRNRCDAGQLDID